MCFVTLDLGLRTIAPPEPGLITGPAQAPLAQGSGAVAISKHGMTNKPDPAPGRLYRILPGRVDGMRACLLDASSRSRAPRAGSGRNEPEPGATSPMCGLRSWGEAIGFIGRKGRIHRENGAFIGLRPGADRGRSGAPVEHSRLTDGPKACDHYAPWGSRHVDDSGDPI